MQICTCLRSDSENKTPEKEVRYVHHPLGQARQQAQAVQFVHRHAAAFLLLRPDVRLLVALRILRLVVTIVVEIAVHPQDQKSANLRVTANLKSAYAANFYLDRM